MPSDNIYSYTRVQMGTLVLLKLCMPDKNLADAVFAETEKLEDTLTVNRPHSPVMEINHAAGKHPVRVGPDVFKLIWRAREASLKPDSCFNLAIGPVVKCWKIGFQGHTPPSPEEIHRLLPLTNPRDVILDADKQTVFLKKSGMEIDLGAIAKGYIADVIKTYLHQRGIWHAIISAGGNIQALGRPFRGPQHRWSIGLQKPFSDSDELIGVIGVVDKSVVTSGIYERYFIAGGRLYHHIFDPTTGYPLDNELLSVTVISDASIDGDICTTLLYGMGVEKGCDWLASQPHIEAIFVTRDKQIILSSHRQFTFDLLDSHYVLMQ